MERVKIFIKLKINYLGVWEHVPVNDFGKNDGYYTRTIFIEPDTLYYHHLDSSNGDVERGYHIDSIKYINMETIVLYYTLDYSWLETPQKDSCTIYMRDNNHIDLITKFGTNLKRIK